MLTASCDPGFTLKAHRVTQYGRTGRYVHRLLATESKNPLRARNDPGAGAAQGNARCSDDERLGTERVRDADADMVPTYARSYDLSQRLIAVLRNAGGQWVDVADCPRGHECSIFQVMREGARPAAVPATMRVVATAIASRGRVSLSAGATIVSSGVENAALE